MKPTAKLFTPLNVGLLELSHRLVTPLGLHARGRGDIGRQPSAADYADHATRGGMLITGPCRISTQGAGAPGCRGLDADDVREWRRITEAVHARGAVIVAQLSHAGASAHTSVNREGPVSASHVPVTDKVLAADGSWIDAETPRALVETEIDAVVEDYRKASGAAREAGFDGIELTATTGTLLGQFLLETTNDRDDDYGGTFDNRIAFLARVVETVSEIWTPGRVGVRLSPWDALDDADPASLFADVLVSLAEQEIAWVNLLREDASVPVDALPGSEECNLARHFRAAFPGVMLFSGRFELSMALAAVDGRLADAVGLYDSALDADLVRRILSLHAPSG